MMVCLLISEIFRLQRKSGEDFPAARLGGRKRCLLDLSFYRSKCVVKTHLKLKLSNLGDFGYSVFEHPRAAFWGESLEKALQTKIEHRFNSTWSQKWGNKTFWHEKKLETTDEFTWISCSWIGLSITLPANIHFSKTRISPGPCASNPTPHALASPKTPRIWVSPKTPRTKNVMCMYVWHRLAPWLLVTSLDVVLGWLFGSGEKSEYLRI